jgi:hypothetical protein
MSTFPLASTVLLIGVISSLALLLFLPYDFRPEDEEDAE